MLLSWSSLQSILTLPALHSFPTRRSSDLVTIAPQLVAPAPVFIVTFAGALIVGAVTSFAVKPVVAVIGIAHVCAPVILSARRPIPTTNPASGLCVMVTRPQLSLAIVLATT